jgi:hypothetical protein
METRRLVWKVVGGLSGVAAGFVTRALLNGTWRRVKGTEPPANPASPRTGWSDALGWAVASGVALAVARLLARRGAAEVWKAAAGAYPPDMDAVS